MNLGQFHTRVSQAIKRGTSLDAIIPLWVAEAARLLEQNYTFSWMRRTQTIVFSPTNLPLTHALSPLVKNVEWAKPVMHSNDGYEWYGDMLVGVDESQVLGISGGNPAGYWITGDGGAYTLHLDAIPRVEYKLRLKAVFYTDWPVLDSAVPALLARGQLALFAQTLILFANEQRDDRMAATYGGILQGALSTLLRSEEDLELKHQNDLKMEYQGLT